MRNRIIKAIKNFDINKLEVLLDDERPFMDVPKSLFIKKLESRRQGEPSTPLRIS